MLGKGEGEEARIAMAAGTGRKLRPVRATVGCSAGWAFEITICDIKRPFSSRVSWKRKSLGKRSMLRFMASLSASSPRRRVRPGRYQGRRAGRRTLWMGGNLGSGMGGGAQGEHRRVGRNCRWFAYASSDPLFDGDTGGDGSGVEGHVVVGVGARNFDAGFLRILTRPRRACARGHCRARWHA